MREFLAYSTFAFTIGLAIGRPRVNARWRIGPATAAMTGVSIMLVFGIVQPPDIASAAQTLWRPFVTIIGVMIMTASARRLGVLDSVAALVFHRPHASIRELFLSVFVLSAVTSSLLNNDAAVLLLTPLVLAFIQRRYPSETNLLVPFAFVVFMAAGVAPFVVSNPMNMIVAAAAGLDFNHYARSMVPISIAGWIIAFLVLRRLFASSLACDSPPVVTALPTARLSALQMRMLLLLFVVLGSYPLVASIDASAIWVVAAGGAVVALTMAWRQGGVNPSTLLARGVQWEILVFLMAVFVISLGLRNVGLVSYLSALYMDAGIALVGTAAATGSAVLNNHPMAILNLLALESNASTGHQQILAALIGGDLGPRLLPVGSLAGLLWLETCRRSGVEIPLREFVRIGFAVTVPTLAASLAILSLG